MGYHFFAAVESVREVSEATIRQTEFLTADYKMLAATYVALAFVAVCLYLGAGVVRKPDKDFLLPGTDIGRAIKILF